MTHSNDKAMEIISEHTQKLVSKIARVCFYNVHFNIATWQLHHNTHILIDQLKEARSEPLRWNP